MSFFDNLHPRSNDGTFTDKTQSAPESGSLLVADPAAIIERLPAGGGKCPGVDSWHQANREHYVSHMSAFDAGPGGATDLFVSSIIDGHLSRGVPGSRGVAALRSWRIFARTQEDATGDERYGQFADGLEAGVANLMAGKLDTVDSETSEHQAQRAEELAKTKRATVEDRERWRIALKHSLSEAEWRGMLVAAAALAGSDDWWGFRENPAFTAIGA